MTASRPFSPLTEDEEWEILHALPTGDRLLVRVLLDLDEGGPLGAYPGYELLARRTGWSGKTVRNRLSRLRKAGVIVSERGGAQGLTRYYVVSPMSRDAGTPDSPSMSRGVGTPEVQNDVPTDVPPGQDIEAVDVPVDVPTGVPTKPPPVGMGIGEGGRGSIKTTSRSRASRTQQGDPSKVTWLTPYWDAWIDAYDGKPNGGVLAKALKALHDEHGEAVVLPRWRYFLSETPAGFVNPHKFASTFGSWEPRQELMSQYSIDPSQVEM